MARTRIPNLTIQGPEYSIGISFGQKPNNFMVNGTLDRVFMMGLAFGFDVHELLAVDY